MLALATFQQIERSDQPRALAKFKSAAQVQRDIEYFKTNIQKVGSVDDLIKNRRLMTFVLSAFGLDSEINALGRIKAVLNSDLSNVNSVANKLSDKRFRDMATELKTQATGLTTIKGDDEVAKLVDRYVANEYEKLLGKTDPAIREARYFQKTIGTITDVYQILADKVLRAVTFKVLGIPPQVAVQPVESQAQLLRSRLDLKQFQTAATSNASASFSNLKSDVSSLALAATVGQTAATAAREAASRLQAIKAGYGNLAAVQDPAGANAAEIPVQTAAIPELVRQRGLAEAAQTALGHLADSLNRMSELRRLAADPANAASLADYKTEFADLANDVHTAVDTSADYRFDGQTRNLLDGSTAGPLTVQIDSAGTTVTLNSHDMSGFLSDIDDAANAFASVADASDTVNLDATRDALALAGPQIGTVRDQVIADRAAAETAIAGVPVWAATLDTQALDLARGSVADADGRASQLAGKLAEIRSIAAESAARLPGDDRSDLEAQFAALQVDVATLIGTPGAGLDNLLAGADRSYALAGGTQLDVANRQLDTSVGSAIAGASLSDIASAQALVDDINDNLLPTVTDARERLAIDAAVVTQAETVFDPRGRLDEQLRDIAADLPGIVAKANSLLAGKNLLADATGLVTTLKSQTGTIFTLGAHPDFAASVNDVVTAAVAQLPGNLSGVGGAYDLLSQAATVAGDIADAIDRDRRALDPTLLDVKRKLAVMPDPGATSSKPTEATKRFVLRYLAIKDSENAQLGASSPMLALFGQGDLGGGTTTPLDISGLVSLGRGGGFVV